MTFGRAVTALASLVALVGGGVAIAAGGGLHDAASVREVAQRGDTYSFGNVPDRTVLISDSALAVLRWTGSLDRLAGTSWETSLESCRRLVYLSCHGRDGYSPWSADREIRELLKRAGPAGPDDVLVISVGYNDWEAHFRDDLATVMGEAYASGFRRVVWLNDRNDVQYVLPDGGNAVRSNYAAMNAILYDEVASGRWPGLSVWDYLRCLARFSTTPVC